MRGNRQGGGRRGGGGGPLGLVAGGVSFAAEAIQHHRNKSKAKKEEEKREAAREAASGASGSRPGPSHEASYGSASNASDFNEPPPYSEVEGEGAGRFVDEKHHRYEEEQEDDLERSVDEKHKTIKDSEEVEGLDEDIWELDDAAADIREAQDPAQKKATIPKGVAKEPARISVLVDAFVAAHPPLPHPGPSRLQCPVIIPQRRPETRARGFVRAYAPDLEPCGISQGAFMDFLAFFDESLEFSNSIKVIQVAGGIVGLIPEAGCQAASIALQATAKVAGGIHSGIRNNDFITRMNQQFFMPMGLVCMILQYQPDNFGDWSSSGGAFNLDKSVQKATEAPHKRIGASHGKTTEIEIPQAAPLIFPALENPADKEKLGKWARMINFTNDYQDRRAQAQFAADNPNSALAAPMEGRVKFESSLADPSKFGGLGDLRGALFNKMGGSSRGGGMRGGYADTQRDPYARGYGSYDDPAGGRMGLLEARLGGRAGRRGRRGWDDEAGPSQYRRRDMGRGQRGGPGGLSQGGPLGMLKKMMKSGVLYLTIVPMPSSSEIRQYEASIHEDLQSVDINL